MPNSPGTVSKILWHFTGGPRWDNLRNCQETDLKPVDEAYRALCGILRSKELRLGSYKEVVKVVVPMVARQDDETGKWVEERDVEEELTSVPVCCLADIPIMHLEYHAKRYGKFAIGFRRESAIANHFNPVFYSPKDSQILRTLYGGFLALGQQQAAAMASIPEDLEYEISQFSNERNAGNLLSPLRNNVRQLATSLNVVNQQLKRLLAFTKTFGRSELSTIYCEREWRSLSSWRFEYSDIAMIVIPREPAEGSTTSHFIEFIDFLQTIPMLRTVPAIPWEDLVEH